MKKIVASYLAVIFLTAAGVYAADVDDAAQNQPSVTPGSTDAGAGSSYNLTSTNTVTGNMQAQAPSATGSASMVEWSSLRGKVKALDPSQNLVRVEDSSGNLFGIKVDQTVRIYRDQNQVNTSDLKINDMISLEHTLD